MICSPTASRRTRAILVLAAWLAMLATARPTNASTHAGTDAADAASLCEAAAVSAARAAGIPETVLLAIALAESGRRRDGRLRPWPWTVNMEGAGHWFDAPGAALDYVARAREGGAVSFDIGCFQINHRWHGQAFDSVEAMFDPLTGARYAAGFLSRLHAEMGNWSAAAGAYHSRTPDLAKRYRARFDTLRARLEDAPPPASPAVPPVAAPPERGNGYRLLVAAGAPGAMGSLVPRDDGGPTPFLTLE